MDNYESFVTFRNESATSLSDHPFSIPGINFSYHADPFLTRSQVQHEGFWLVGFPRQSKLDANRQLEAVAFKALAIQASKVAGNFDYIR